MSQKITVVENPAGTCDGWSAAHNPIMGVSYSMHAGSTDNKTGNHLFPCRKRSPSPKIFYDMLEARMTKKEIISCFVTPACRVPQKITVVGKSVGTCDGWSAAQKPGYGDLLRHVASRDVRPNEPFMSYPCLQNVANNHCCRKLRRPW